MSLAAVGEDEKLPSAMCERRSAFVQGKPPALPSEQVAAPTVRGHLSRSLAQLKRQVEHEQGRRAAARRRGADVSAT